MAWWRAEALFATLERELRDRRRFTSQGRSPDGCVRLHRGLLQSDPASLSPGLPLAYRIRGKNHAREWLIPAHRPDTEAERLQSPTSPSRVSRAIAKAPTSRRRPRRIIVGIVLAQDRGTGAVFGPVCARGSGDRRLGAVEVATEPRVLAAVSPT